MTAIVATVTGAGVDRLTLHERVTVTTSGWLAARVTSRKSIHSGFATSMGAHSSPVYLDVRRPTAVRSRGRRSHRDDHRRGSDVDRDGRDGSLVDGP